MSLGLLITPQPAGRGNVSRELRQLRDAVTKLEPMRGANMRFRRTSRGVAYVPHAAGTTTIGGEAVWK